MLIKIENDVYFISSRIKEIDCCYFICFNTQKKVFEIHNSSQKFNTYCLTLPYKYLDFRTLEYVRKTQIQNRQALIKEIDRENEKLENSKLSKLIDQTQYNVKQVLFGGQCV